MIYLLLIFLIIEFITSYCIFNKDLFSPSAIISEVFILSTLACIYNIDNWGVNLKYITFLIIIGGNGIFILTSYIIHIFSKKCSNKNNSGKLDFIDVSYMKCFILLILYSIFSIVFIKTNVSSISSFNNSDISGAMNMYRRELVEGMIQLPGWLSKINVILNLGVYILIYIIINNLIVNFKKKNSYILLICVIIYLISSIFTAQRTTILLAFIYSLFVSYELLNRKYNFSSKLNSKYVKRGLVFVLLFLLSFALTRGMFGRNDKRSNIENITYYMGNSIESLDLYIDNPIENNQFGEELFRQFRITLYSFGLCEDTTMENNHLEFRKDANGNSAGNIYTSYRNYIHDFGYKSIIFFQIIIAIFYGIWYEKLKKRNLKNGIDISFIMYSWFVLCLFRFSLTSSFFTFLSYFIFTHWYTFLIWKFILNIKIRIGNKLI